MNTIRTSYTLSRPFLISPHLARCPRVMRSSIERLRSVDSSRSSAIESRFLYKSHNVRCIRHHLQLQRCERRIASCVRFILVPSKFVSSKLNMVHLVAFVVSALCVSCLLAAPAPQTKQQDPEEIQLVRYVNENNGIDPYRYT